GVPMHDAPVEEVSFNYGQARIVYQHSSARVEFDQPPTSFTATVQIEGKHEGNSLTRNTGHLVVGVDNVDLAAQRSQIGSMSISFTGLESGGCSLQADASEANGFPVFAFEG